MPNKRENNYINKKLQENINFLIFKLKDIDSKAIGRDHAANLTMQLTQLKGHELMSFDEDGNIIPEAYEKYHKLCDTVKQTFYNLSELATNNLCPKEVKDLITYVEDFRGQVTAEISPFTKEPAFKTDWNLNEEQTKDRDRLLNEWMQYVESNDMPQISYYSEDAFQPRIPNDIKLTGDINDIASFYVRNAAIMNDSEKVYLRGLAQTLIFYDKLEQDTKQYQPSSKFSVEVNLDTNGVELTGFGDDYQYQNTANGCWSCTYSMLLKSRGINLDQRLIRSFRTNRNFYQNSHNPKHAAGAGLLSDSGYNPTDIADLTSKLLPNTAMHTAVFSGFNAMDPQTRADNAAVMKQMVYNQLRYKKNPVAMSIDGHYMTIVGLEGDNFKILDSIDRTNDSHIVTLSMSKVLSSKGANLVWLDDLNRTPDNKVAVGSPFEHVKYSGNTLVSTGTQEGINTAGEMFDGLGMYTVDPNREPIFVQESLYAPYNLTDPSLLKVKKANEKSLMDKKFAVESPVQHVIAEDIQAFNSVFAPGEELDEDHQINNENEVLKRSVALMITHKCMGDDFKYVLEDKHVIERTLRHDTDVAGVVARLDGFEEFVDDLGREGGPLYQKDKLDAKIVDEIYKSFSSKFPKPVSEINKAMNKDIDPKQMFDSKAFVSELQEIDQQIKKASKNYKKSPQGNYKMLSDTLNGLYGTFSANPGGIERGRKSYNRLFNDFAVTASKLKYNRGWSVGGKMPTASEIQELKLLQRIDNAHRFVASKFSPEEIAKQKLCEKLLAAKATNLIKSKNKAEAQLGLNILTDTQTHTEQFNTIYNDPGFKSITAGKDLAALNKLVKSDNDKMLKTYNKTVVKLQAAAKEPVKQNAEPTAPSASKTTVVK